MTDIDKLVAAIDRLTQVLSVAEGTVATHTAEFEAPAPAPVSTVAVPKAVVAGDEKPTITITVNDLRNLAQALLDKGKLASIQKINADHGIKRLSEATSAQINSIHQALTAALE